jgi:hypothetical protein
MSWIVPLADYLQTQSLGTKGTNLFVGMMPDTNSVCTVLMAYDGEIVETMTSGIALYKPQLQVRVRGAKEDYTTPYNRLLAIQDALSTISNQTLGGVKYLRVRPTSNVNSLGQDTNLRFDFTVNFEVTYE